LAVDQSYAGKGIGTGLLKHALTRCVEGAALIGGRALIVNAIDDEARLFWTRRGFLPSRDDAFRLIRPMSHIAASLEAAGSGG
jgi:GNAT superfamily N-acetyltransferase